LQIYSSDRSWVATNRLNSVTYKSAALVSPLSFSPWVPSFLIPCWDLKPCNHPGDAANGSVTTHLFVKPYGLFHQ
jgi:hypothetical protein